MADVILEVTDAELQSITQSVLIRYGIDFTCYEPKSLKRRIIRVLNIFELNSTYELWVKLLRDPKFVYTFMNEVSVGMTSMFRDPILWNHLKSRIAESYWDKPIIDIWHAGCSTGEEVFTMAILLKEINFLNKARSIATDFNHNALSVAQQGLYHKIKMIENEANYKSYNQWGEFGKYYQREVNDCVMDNSLITHVKYSYQNLITEAAPSPSLFDTIFCRNVMIYFDTKAKQNLLTKFFSALKPGGLFIIGFFDTMSHLIDSKQFELIDEQAKIFKKVAL